MTNNSESSVSCVDGVKIGSAAPHCDAKSVEHVSRRVKVDVITRSSDFPNQSRSTGRNFYRKERHVLRAGTDPAAIQGSIRRECEAVKRVYSGVSWVGGCSG